MKKHSLIFLFAIALGIIGCGGNSSTEPTVTPVPGEWGGTKIRFFVSTDGSALTASGSSLPQSASEQQRHLYSFG